MAKKNSAGAKAATVSLLVVKKIKAPIIRGTVTAMGPNWTPLKESSAVPWSMRAKSFESPYTKNPQRKW